MTSKNFETKLILYNALLKQEYERVFMSNSMLFNTLSPTTVSNANSVPTPLLFREHGRFPSHNLIHTPQNYRSAADVLITLTVWVEGLIGE
ncbi:hypothetical protein L1987_21223 [Smallanthus sonchifolius]|uniref:Uncharacterized protein n=1 Tax=Smallanthus sonchifolius TaxID=185202 RepID=A0ACB9IU04_9ASTR|nr:hypothetical protein L1987_21223 [Smallanthus sonchifolius]